MIIEGIFSDRHATNHAMTLFTSLGPSADCRRLTQITKYQARIGHARGAAFSVSPRGFSLGWGLQGKVARTPHQSKGSEGTVCTPANALYLGELKRLDSARLALYR